MSSLEVALVAVGVSLVLMALFVEIEHKIIWNNYKKHYHKHKNKFVDRLLRPNKTVYHLNIYLVWPLVLILGIVIIIMNV